MSKIIYLIICAFLHSKIERAIEGSEGWAANLPCKRWNKGWEKLLGGKPLTSYHLYMLILAQLIFHICFLFIPWSLKQEYFIQSCFAFYFVIEDFLWFCIGKENNLSNFFKKQIPWHKRWVGFLPLTYWIGIIIGILFLILSQ